jgi:hypothetical protein
MDYLVALMGRNMLDRIAGEDGLTHPWPHYGGGRHSSAHLPSSMPHVIVVTMGYL